jgi:hypothetical protein
LEPWDGQVFFEGGRVVAASFLNERGVPALEAMTLGMSHAAFAFGPGAAPAGEHNVELAPEALQAHLRKVAGQARAHLVPSPLSIPTRARGAGADDRLILRRASLEVLLGVDGRRSVDELGAEFGVASALHALVQLHVQGLVQWGGPAAAAGQRSARPGLATGSPFSRAHAAPWAWLTKARALARPGAWLGREPGSPLARVVPLGVRVLTPIGVGLLPALLLVALMQFWPAPRDRSPRAPLALTPASVADAPDPSGQPPPPSGQARPFDADGSVAGVSSDRPAPDQPSGPTTPLEPNLVLSNDGSQPFALPVRERVANTPGAGPAVATPSPGPSDDFGAGLPLARSWETWQPLRLTVATPGRYLAVGVQPAPSLRDTSVWGDFRKTGGPFGSAYGLIVRDAGPDPRDGVSQGGRYYVFEVSDKGEIGAWRREVDHWVQLQPWTPHFAARPGNVTNRLQVDARGERLTFLVNGVRVLEQSDATLPEGGVGVYVDGDFNDVRIDRLIIAG